MRNKNCQFEFFHRMNKRNYMLISLKRLNERMIEEHLTNRGHKEKKN